MLYIGVDLGTSSVKVLLTDENGTIQKIVTKEYPLSFPKPGWAEQNPADWQEALMVAIKELMVNTDEDQVEGISFSGQMHGLVLLDENDEVIRPAILWNDGRTQVECQYLNETIGRDKLSSYTGNIALTGFTAPKLLWVRTHEPDNFARIDKIMLPKDYLAYRLTKVHCTDVSDASGMLLLDVKKKCWSQEMMEIVGVKKEQLATLYESYQVVGTLCKEVAKQLGLPETVKVIAGGGDQAVAAVGTGTVGDGKCNISLGTSGVVFVSSERYAVDDQNALHSFAHADGKYHFMGCMLSAAGANKWWMEQILRTKEYQTEQENLKVLGKNSVYFLPYLMGERTPHNDPNARGTFLGMTMDTTREDMTQAVLEGVAFALRDTIEILRSLGISITRTRINGGGAKSPLWCKIIANVLDVQVDKINSEEGPAFGAAILAMVGCGVYQTVEEATSHLLQVVETISPDEELVKRYDHNYQMYRTLYPTLKSVFQELQAETN